MRATPLESATEAPKRSLRDPVTRHELLLLDPLRAVETVHVGRLTGYPLMMSSPGAPTRATAPESATLCRSGHLHTSLATSVCSSTHCTPSKR